MKRYIVFLKQVPLSTKVEMDPVTRTLKRSSAMTRTNPDDLYALQLAVKLKRQTEAEIVAVSMGPASAEEVLREALQRGADKAVLLSSKAFAGSDTWCTSLVLAAAVRKLGEYYLLLFGKMAVDGDTAQVGPEVAGQLDIPQVTHLIGGFGHIGYLYVCEEEGRSFTPTYGGGFTLCRDGWPGDGGTGLSHTDRLAVGSAADHPSLG